MFKKYKVIYLKVKVICLKGMKSYVKKYQVICLKSIKSYV